MSILGNILWFICGGLLSGLSWVLAGCLWCISIIGIPIGLQCFKFAGLAFFPFGKEVVYGGGAVSLIANIIWLIVSGIPMAVENAVAGLICCITIIGIPFGKQFFKIVFDAIWGRGNIINRRSSSNYRRGSYQASSWRLTPPLLYKTAKWKTVGLIFETKIR